MSHPHRPTTLSGRIPWPVCAKCGLLYLKNKATQKALRAGCSVEGKTHSGRFGARVTVRQGRAGVGLPLEKGWETWR